MTSTVVPSSSGDRTEKPVCGAPSAKKLWTITSRGTARTRWKYSEPTDRSSNRKLGGNILLVKQNQTGLFSSAQANYRGISMATVQEDILKAFYAKLAKSKEFDKTMIDAVRTLVGTDKKLK